MIHLCSSDSGLNNPRSVVGGTEEAKVRVSCSPKLIGSSSEANPAGTSTGGGAGALSSLRGPRAPNSDYTDALLSGNDSAGRESEGGAEGEGGSRGGQSTRSSQCSSSHHGKDSAMILETTESNKSGSMAYSLLSASSGENPASTSGCSSAQSARLQTQKELSRALKELKIRIPAERKGKGRSSTLNALKYALNCVKQVRANQEYYHQWSVEESHGCSLDLSTFTFEELDNITSEYTLKNTDTFSMAVSFLSGKVVYISPQGSSQLRCKPELLQGALFSELLAPQDISTFYSCTSPRRLPQWATCLGSDSTREKSMFCRISGGRKYEGGVRYYPFRLTPYQLTLRDSDVSDPQPCCLLIAERVPSGFEAPRIPPDKRIFTTRHTPSCLFLEVDERAVPLLGYLPQDLVGKPLLLYLHPEDRPVMVAIHKKILQFAGQPFDHSPLRMCARSGEYLTIDTSWSSFVNPWSRKVAFIVGRHKVRTSPLNEVIFNPRRGAEGRAMPPEIQQLSEQIHRLLVQPVHSSSSQGYCSLGSNGSHEPHPSAASSNESAAATEEPAPLHKPMTFQQICKDVHIVKSNGQQVFIESRNRHIPRKHSSTGVVKTFEVTEVAKLRGVVTKRAVAPPNVTPLSQPLKKETTPAYSYQQINCLDSIVRYLESCNIPNTVKRKCGSSSCTASSISDDDKQKDLSGTPEGVAVTLAGDTAPLPPLALHSKAESVASVTSQCSFTSTIVHVGDKKPPESGSPGVSAESGTLHVSSVCPSSSISGSPGVSAVSDIVMEEAPPTPTPAPNRLIVAPFPERDGRKGGTGRAGLTKDALLVHTQQEEQVFLSRFQDLSQLRAPAPGPALNPRGERHRPAATPFSRGVRSTRDYPAAGSSGRRRGRGGKRLKHQEVSDQGSSVGPRATLLGPLGAMAGGAERPTASPLPPHDHVSLGQTSSSSWPTPVDSQTSLPSVAYHPGVLPICPLYPALAPSMPPAAASTHQAGLPNPDPSLCYPLQSSHLAPPPMVAFVLPNYIFPQSDPPISQPSSRTPPVPQHYNPNPMFPFPQPTSVVSTPLPPSTPPTPTLCAPSRSGTPQSCSQTPPERDGMDSPLFQSRCSSPLNLLQLEESPSNRPEAASALAIAQQPTPPVSGAAPDWTTEQGSIAGGKAPVNRRIMAGHAKENDNAESSNQDATSTSSDLLDLLLQEDSRSGTGSAASGSGSSGSGSNGFSVTGSGTRSSRSSRTSRYFGSVDSSENGRSARRSAGAAGEEQVIKYVLQDPIWLLMANADEKVMMTYQLPVRNREEVLREDRRTLRAMQKHQPRFAESQKRELIQVHPWIHTGRLPRAIDLQACAGCGLSPDVQEAAPFDVQIHDVELSGVTESPPVEGMPRTTPDGSASLAPPETTMEEDGGGASAPTNDQEMTAEE